MHEVRMFLSGTLQAGVQQGQFRETNSFMVHMLIIGFLNFYAAGTPIREKIFRLDDSLQCLSVFDIKVAGTNNEEH